MTDADTPAPMLIGMDGGVMTVTLNAPRLRNSMAAPGLKTALHAAVERFAVHDTARVLVLTGAGGAFSAGGDLKQLRELDPIALRQRLAHGAKLFRCIVQGEKPVIAAVEGPAFGAGLGLVAACDVVVAARDARFCAAFVRVGAMPDAALFWSLPWRVGPAKARDLMMFADELDGVEAVRIGLADRLVEPGQALAEAQRLACRLVEGPSIALRRIKATIRHAPMSFDQALQAELDNAPQIFATEDFREGAQAFLEKRKPRFQGR